MKIPSYVTVRDLPSGRRYEVRIEVTGPGGERRQVRRRFKVLKDAIAAHAKVTAERAAGTHIAPTDLTVKSACEAWLSGRRVKPTTHAAYSFALQPVIDTYGDRKVQSITKADVEALVAALRDGTTDRGVWSRTSINPMLARWRSVWQDLHAQGVLARNVVALVEPLRKPSGEAAMKTDDTLSEAEVKRLVDAHGEGAEPSLRRRELFVHLALLGMRRGEISGLRWSAVVLTGESPTLTIRATRVATVAGIIEQSDAKTASSERTLPIPAHLLPILRRVRKVQRERQLLAGSKWAGPADGYVIALDLGEPPSPRTLNAWWNASLRDAKLPHRRLHASRHTAASLLNLRGAPVTMIAAWLGHGDGGVLAMRTYVHTSNAILQAAAKLLGEETG